jgi:hypothetical protein
MVYFYDTDEFFCKFWDKMTDGNCSFSQDGKCIILEGESLSFENADYILVINGGIYPDPKLFPKIIFAKMEPIFVDDRWRDVGSWPVFKIFGTHGNFPLTISSEFLNLKNSGETKLTLNETHVEGSQLSSSMVREGSGLMEHPSTFNMLEWHLNMTRKDLLTQKIVKSKNNVISAFISGKMFSPGHFARVHFVLFAQQYLDWDVYGNYNSKRFLWNNYLGAPEYKNEALLPYKYSFACENHFTDYYVTEKLIDCILAETLCFYDGAPNVDKLIDPRAFIKIDIRTPVNALTIIKTCIENNEYESRIEFIKAAKINIINKISALPQLLNSIWEKSGHERGVPATEGEQIL